MSIRSIGRLATAAVLAVGLLIITAIPASATVRNVGITWSSTTDFSNPFSGTTANHHVEGHATNNVCAPNSSPSDAILFDFNSSGGATIGASSTTYEDFILGANSFKSRMNIVSGTMTLAPSNASLTVTINFEVRNCASTTVLCRTNNVNITLTGSNPTGTLHPTYSTSFFLGGTSATRITVSTPCNYTIRSAIHNHWVYANWNLYVFI